MKAPEPASSTADFKAPVGLILVLGGLSAFGPFSIDMYLPGLSQMTRDLHAGAADGALSVAAFYIGVSLGQLFYGPLSDRIGRRPPLLAGVALYVAASIGCAFAPSVGLLIGLRLLQALGGCAGLVISRAVVRDRFSPQQTAHVFSMLMLVMSLAPIVAPLLGGFVLLVGNWRMIFWVLAVFGSLVWLSVLLWMQESRSAETEAKARGESAWKSYLAVLREPRVMGYCFAAGFAQAGLLTYIAAAPSLVIDSYGVSPQGFSYIFACNGVGLVTATYTNRRLLRTKSYDYLLRRANMASLLASAVLVVDAITGFGGLWGFVVPLFFVVACMGFTQANAFAGAMALDPHRAGSTSAMVGCLQFGLGAVAGSIAGALHDGTARPIAIVILISYVLSGLALRLLAKVRD